MLLRPLPLPDAVPGRLWLSPMPGRQQPFADFLEEARQAGLTRIVCLTPLHEAASLSPHYHDAIVDGSLPCQWRQVAMRDFGVGESADAFAEFIDELAGELRAGEKVLLHCAAGIGRTGTAAACLLKRLGVPTQQALRRVRAAGSDPQSALQSGLIEAF
jgi:protein-tyrosine phosphatase